MLIVLAGAERARARERRTENARAAALRGADAVQTLLSSLEIQIQNGTANPRLVAALGAKVDAETLRDLLLNEPWWDSFRRSVDGFALYGDDVQAIVESHLPAGFEARTIVRQARQAHRARSGLAVVGGQVVLVAVDPIVLAGRSTEPALVFIRALDEGALASVAERAGGVVAISDGRQLLVVAPSRTGSDGRAALA